MANTGDVNVFIYLAACLTLELMISGGQESPTLIELHDSSLIDRK